MKTMTSKFLRQYIWPTSGVTLPHSPTREHLTPLNTISDQLVCIQRWIAPPLAYPPTSHHIALHVKSLRVPCQCHLDPSGLSSHSRLGPQCHHLSAPSNHCSAIQLNFRDFRNLTHHTYYYSFINLLQLSTVHGRSSLHTREGITSQGSIKVMYERQSHSLELLN